MAYFDDNTIVFLDGKYMKATEAKLGFFSETIHYGYGVFEGIRSYNTHAGTRIFKAKEHYDRLINSARALHIPFAYSAEEMIEVNYVLLEKNGLKDAYIRPMVYCNVPNMSLYPPVESALFMAVWEWGLFLGEKMLNVMGYAAAEPKEPYVKADATNPSTAPAAGDATKP